MNKQKIYLNEQKGYKVNIKSVIKNVNFIKNKDKFTF